MDDDDDVSHFSLELRNAYVPYHFVPKKIPKYEENGDHAKYLNNYKTHMSLKGASTTLMYRVFHLILTGVAENGSRIAVESI